MERRVISVISAFLLLMNMLTLTFNIQSVIAQGTIIVPDDYPTVQAAIDAAQPGDTVFVKSGSYYENVIVNKTLALIGENARTAIIDANGNGAVFSVMSNGVSIEGFTIRNSGYGSDGVHIDGYTQTTIRNNNIGNNGQYGVGLYYSYFNKVTGNNVTNNWSGINLSYSSNNTISGNTMTGNGYGIVLSYSSSNNSASRNKVTAQGGTGIVVSGWSGNNTVSGNIIANTENGISIYLSSSNTIFENNITDTGSGIYVSNFSNNNTLYHNNLVNNTNQVYSSDSVNVWDDGYPSGGNYWSDYTGLDVYSGPYQNETGSDGIGDTQYAIDTGNVDYYPFISPFTVIHDIAVTNVTPLKTIVGQGYSMGINVTVQNQGSEPEIFNTTLNRLGARIPLTLIGRTAQGWNSTSPGPTITVAIYDDIRLTLTSGDGITHRFYVDYNGNASPSPGEPTSPSFTTTIQFAFIANTPGTFTYFCSFHQATMFGTFSVNPTPTTNQISVQQATLSQGEQKILTFTWNTAGVQKANYTISAVATSVPGETDTADNTLTNGAVAVLTPGDVNADGVVDILDISGVSAHWYPGPPLGPSGYGPNFDINDDGSTDILEVSILSAYWTGPPKGPLDP